MEWKYILTKKHKFKLLYSSNLYQTVQMYRRYDNQFYAIFKKWVYHKNNKIKNFIIKIIIFNKKYKIDLYLK